MIQDHNFTNMFTAKEHISNLHNKINVQKYINVFLTHIYSQNKIMFRCYYCKTVIQYTIFLINK